MTLGRPTKGCGVEPRAGHFRGPVTVYSDLTSFCAPRKVGPRKVADTRGLAAQEVCSLKRTAAGHFRWRRRFVGRAYYLSINGAPWAPFGGGPRCHSTVGFLHYRSFLGISGVPISIIGKAGKMAGYTTPMGKQPQRYLLPAPSVETDIESAGGPPRQGAEIGLSAPRTQKRRNQRRCPRVETGAAPIERT